MARLRTRLSLRDLDTLAELVAADDGADLGPLYDRLTLLRMWARELPGHYVEVSGPTVAAAAGPLEAAGHVLGSAEA